MKKWQNYGLWVSLISAVLLAVQSVGILFDYQITPEQYDGILTAFNSVLGVLVVLGVVSNPNLGKGYSDRKDNT